MNPNAPNNDAIPGSFIKKQYIHPIKRTKDATGNVFNIISFKL